MKKNNMPSLRCQYTHLAKVNCSSIQYILKHVMRMRSMMK